MAVTNDNAEPKPAPVKVNAPEGVTTKDDAADLGVPMAKGETVAFAGPEDALGVEPTRGDYSDRIGPSNYHPHEAVRNEDGYALEAQRDRV